MIFMSVTLSRDFVVINYQAQTISQVSLGNKSSPAQLHHITFKKLLFSSVFLSEVLGDSARTELQWKGNILSQPFLDTKERKKVPDIFTSLFSHGPTLAVASCLVNR